MKKVLTWGAVILALIAVPFVVVALHVVADIVKFIFWEAVVAFALGLVGFLGWKAAH